ncbi:VCBS repeat-containing protein [Paenibacillus sp. J5C_2022]|nr:VCBS repeat-containing protein [Paenibacillus sp. J5C2022]
MQKDGKPGLKPFALDSRQWKELGEGLHATAFMLDYFGDGGRDILYATDPYLMGRGVHVYAENKKSRGRVPRYERAFKLEQVTGSYAMPLQINDDRRFHILTYAGTFPDRELEQMEPDPGWLKLYRNEANGAIPSFSQMPERVKVNGQSLAEALPGLTQLTITPFLTASGKTDLIVCGTSNWMRYWPMGKYGGGLNEHPHMGFGRGYDEHGEWTGEKTASHIYWLENIGSNDYPAFAAPHLLHQVESFGLTTDALLFDVDKDGFAELLVRQHTDRMYYYKTSNRRVLPETRKELPCSPLAKGYFQTSLCACDIDGDGEQELLVTGNPGIVFWLDERDGQWTECSPLLQQGGDVRGETLAVPCLADMDQDGDLDMIIGDASGYLWYYENQADMNGRYHFKSGIRLSAGEAIVHHQAGPVGSLQGPSEARWGYTNPLVADWDGDGRPDLIVNDIKGEYWWYRNAGEAGALALEAGKPLLAGGAPYIAAWRSRPAIWGENRLLVINRDGMLQLLRRDGDDPQIVHEAELLTYRNKCAIRACGTGGSSGRAALFACDWDEDGVEDLVIGVPAGASHYFNVCFPLFATVFWLKNVGTNAVPVFDSARLITMKDGTPINLVWHQCAPWCVDLDGDGRLELICGAEDGKVYSWHRDELKWDWDPATDWSLWKHNGPVTV